MFETLSLIIKNKSIWPIKLSFYKYNTRFFQRSLFIQVLSLEVLEKDIKGLKRKEGLKKRNN